jgi:hypothetical protein
MLFSSKKALLLNLVKPEPNLNPVYLVDFSNRKKPMLKV